MPVNIRMIHTKIIIKVTVTGVLNFTAGKQAILDLASEIPQPGAHQILVDTREAESVLSSVAIFELDKALATQPSLQQSRIALLTPMRDIRDAEFLETTAANRGARIQAFADFEQAFCWLVMQDDL